MAVKNVKFNINVDTTQATQNLGKVVSALKQVEASALAATSAAAKATAAFGNIPAAHSPSAQQAGAMGAAPTNAGAGIGNISRGPRYGQSTADTIDFLEQQIREKTAQLKQRVFNTPLDKAQIAAWSKEINVLKNSIFELQNAGVKKPNNVLLQTKKQIDELSLSYRELRKTVSSANDPTAGPVLQNIRNEIKKARDEYNSEIAKMKDINSYTPSNVKSYLAQSRAMENNLRSADKTERIELQNVRNQLKKQSLELQKDLSIPSDAYKNLAINLEQAKIKLKEVGATDMPGLEAAKKEIDAIEKSMKNIRRGGEPAQNSTLGLKEKRAELIKKRELIPINTLEYDTTTQEIAAIDAQLKALTKTANVAKDSIQGMKNQLKELKSQRSLIDIKAEPAKFKAVSAEIDTLTKQIEKLEGVTQKGSNSFMTYAKYAATSIIIYQGINAVIDSIVSGFTTALNTEQFTVAMEVLMKDVTEARNKIGELKAFAASTPLEMSDIEQSSKTLLAFGVAADSLIPTMRMLGDLALGNGTQFRHLAVIYGQAAATGRVMSGDLNQLANRGVPILRELAKQLNTTEAGVRKLASEGKINFKILDTALKSMTGAGGSFENMMERMSRTTEGRLAKLSDDFKFAMGDIVKSMLPAIKDIIDSITKGVEAFSNLYTGFKMMGDGAKAFIAIMLYFISTMGLFNTMTTGVIARVGALATSLGILKNQFIQANSSTLAFITSLKFVGDAIIGIGLKIGKAVASFAIWTIAIYAVTEGIAKLIEYLNEMGTLQNEISKAKFLAAESAAEELDHVTSITFELGQQNTLVTRQIEIVGELNNAYGDYVEATLSVTSSLAEQLNYLEMVKNAIMNITLINNKQAAQSKIGAKIQEDNIKLYTSLSQISQKGGKQADIASDIIKSMADEERFLNVYYENIVKSIIRNESIPEEIAEKKATIEANKNTPNTNYLNNIDKAEKEIKRLEMQKSIAIGIKDKDNEMRYAARIKVLEDEIKNNKESYDKLGLGGDIERRSANIKIAENRIKELEEEKLKIEKDLKANPMDVEEYYKIISTRNKLINQISQEDSGFWEEFFGKDPLNTVRGLSDQRSKSLIDKHQLSAMTQRATYGLIPDKIKKEEEKQVELNNATGRYIKLKQYELDLLRAKIQPILDNTRALQEQRKEMELEQDIILKGGRSSVAEFILPTDKDIEASAISVRDKAEAAYQDLNKQLVNALDGLAKQRENALEKAAEARAHGGKNMQAELNALAPLTNIESYNKQRITLEKNYAEEYQRIVKADEEQIYQLYLNAYKKRALAFTQYIQTLKKERIEALHENKQSMLDIESLSLEALSSSTTGVNSVDAAGIIAANEYKVELDRMIIALDEHNKQVKKLQQDQLSANQAYFSAIVEQEKNSLKYQELSKMKDIVTMKELALRRRENTEQLIKYAEEETARRESARKAEELDAKQANHTIKQGTKAELDTYRQFIEDKRKAINEKNKLDEEEKAFKGRLTPEGLQMVEEYTLIENLLEDKTLTASKMEELQNRMVALNIAITNEQLKSATILNKIQLQALQSTRKVAEARIAALEEVSNKAMEIIDRREAQENTDNLNVLGFVQSLQGIKSWKNTIAGKAAYARLAEIQRYREELRNEQRKLKEDQAKLDAEINRLMPITKKGKLQPGEVGPPTQAESELCALEAQRKGTESGIKLLEDKQKDAANKQRKQQQDIEEEETEDWRDKALKVIAGIEQLGKAIIQGLSAVWQAEANLINNLIEGQEKKIEEARQRAIDSKGAGDAELLQLEEERLEKLDTLRKDNLAKQRNLATAELIINSVLSVSRALLTAAEDPIGAIFAVATTLTTLSFGLAAARAQAEADAASFATGGYTGDKPGDTKNRTTNVSKDPNIAGVVHTKEFVFPKHQTEANRDIFEGIYKGNINLRDMLRKADLYDNIPDSARSHINSLVSALDDYKQNNVSGFISNMSKAGGVSSSFREMFKDVTSFNNIESASILKNDINRIMILDKLSENSINNQLIAHKLPNPSLANFNINYHVNNDNSNEINGLRDDVKQLTKIIAEQERLSVNIDMDGVAMIVSKKLSKISKMNNLTK